MSGNHAHAHHEHGPEGHGGHHSHAPASYGKAFAVGIALNAGFVFTEWVVGISANSLALIADAAHNLSDVLSLLLSWGAVVLARRHPTRTLTYGLRGSSIVAALVNAAALFVVTGALAWEAISRLRHPGEVQGLAVAATAAGGIVVNGVTAWLFMRGRKSDLNIRAAYLHMLADAAVSVAVLVAGGLVAYTGWFILDPLLTLAVSAFIIWQTTGLLRESFRLSVQGVPESIDVEKVRTFLRALPGVSEFHDLHVWAISTTENALTAHLVVPGRHPGDAFLRDAGERLAHDFGIGHATLQIEIGDTAAACPLAPDHVV